MAEFSPDRRRFEGNFSAVLTPMTEDGEDIVIDQTGEYAAFLARDGVSGAFVCGTSGESMSLSVEERKKIASAWCSKSPKGFQIIVHVGAQSLKDCKELAAHSESIGAAAIAIMAPCFFKPSNVSQLVDFLHQVSLSAPKTSVLYYQFPVITGVSFDMYDVLVNARDRGLVPNLRGGKFTSSQLHDYHRCVAMDDGKYDILMGYENMWLPALSLGAKGSVSLSHNGFHRVFERIRRAFNENDLKTARSWQLKATELLVLCGTYGPAPMFKVLTGARYGIAFGGVRLPQRSLSADESAALLSHPSVKAMMELVEGN